MISLQRFDDSEVDEEDINCGNFNVFGLVYKSMMRDSHFIKN